LLLTVTSVWTYAVAQLAALATRPAELFAGAAALAVATLIAVAVAVHLVGWSGATADPARRAATLRARARHSRVSRQLDPDASGRPRPRAPSAYASAA
jgi:hypothetical protein